jgi:hypothetical protein
MNKNSNIKYVPGWNGGCYSLNGIILLQQEVRELARNSSLIIDGKTYPISIRNVDGVDYDHGHEYTWSFSQIGIFLSTELINDIFIPLEELQKKTRKKITLKPFETQDS